MCLSGIAASCNTCDALSFSKSISTVLMMPQDSGERMTEWCSRHDARVHHASRATPGWEGWVRRSGFGTHPYEMPGWGCGGHSHLTSGKMPGMEHAPIRYLLSPRCPSASRAIPTGGDGSAVHAAYPRESPRPVFGHIPQVTPTVPHGWIGYSRMTTPPMPCGDAQDQSSLGIRATTCTTDTADAGMFSP